MFSARSCLASGYIHQPLDGKTETDMPARGSGTMILTKTAEIIRTLASSNPQLRSQYDRYDTQTASKPCSDYHYYPCEMEDLNYDIDVIHEDEVYGVEDTHDPCSFMASNTNMAHECTVESAFFTIDGRDSPVATSRECRESSYPEQHEGGVDSKIRLLHSVSDYASKPALEKSDSRASHGSFDVYQKASNAREERGLQADASNFSKATFSCRIGKIPNKMGASASLCCENAEKLRSSKRRCSQASTAPRRGLWERLAGCFGTAAAPE